MGTICCKLEAPQEDPSQEIPTTPDNYFDSSEGRYIGFSNNNLDSSNSALPSASVDVGSNAQTITTQPTTSNALNEKSKDEASSTKCNSEEIEDEFDSTWLSASEEDAGSNAKSEESEDEPYAKKRNTEDVPFQKKAEVEFDSTGPSASVEDADSNAEVITAKTITSSSLTAKREDEPGCSKHNMEDVPFHKKIEHQIDYAAQGNNETTSSEISNLNIIEKEITPDMHSVPGGMEKEVYSVVSFGESKDDFPFIFHMNAPLTDEPSTSHKICQQDLREGITPNNPPSILQVTGSQMTSVKEPEMYEQQFHSEIPQRRGIYFYRMTEEDLINIEQTDDPFLVVNYTVSEGIKEISGFLKKVTINYLIKAILEESNMICYKIKNCTEKFIILQMLHKEELANETQKGEKDVVYFKVCFNFGNDEIESVSLHRIPKEDMAKAVEKNSIYFKLQESEEDPLISQKVPKDLPPNKNYEGPTPSKKIKLNFHSVVEVDKTSEITKHWQKESDKRTNPDELSSLTCPNGSKCVDSTYSGSLNEMMGNPERNIEQIIPFDDTNNHPIPCEVYGPLKISAVEFTDISVFEYETPGNQEDEMRVNAPKETSTLRAKRIPWEKGTDINVTLPELKVFIPTKGHQYKFQLTHEFPTAIKITEIHPTILNAQSCTSAEDRSSEELKEVVVLKSMEELEKEAMEKLEKEAMEKLEKEAMEELEKAIEDSTAVTEDLSTECKVTSPGQYESDVLSKTENSVDIDTPIKHQRQKSLTGEGKQLQERMDVVENFEHNVTPKNKETEQIQEIKTARKYYKPFWAYDLAIIAEEAQLEIEESEPEVGLPMIQSEQAEYHRRNQQFKTTQTCYTGEWPPFSAILESDSEEETEDTASSSESYKLSDGQGSLENLPVQDNADEHKEDIRDEEKEDDFPVYEQDDFSELEEVYEQEDFSELEEVYEQEDFPELEEVYEREDFPELYEVYKKLIFMTNML